MSLTLILSESYVTDLLKQFQSYNEGHLTWIKQTGVYVSLTMSHITQFPLINLLFYYFISRFHYQIEFQSWMS